MQDFYNILCTKCQERIQEACYRSSNYKGDSILNVCPGMNEQYNKGGKGELNDRCLTCRYFTKNVKEIKKENPIGRPQTSDTNEPKKPIFTKEMEIKLNSFNDGDSVFFKEEYTFIDIEDKTAYTIEKNTFAKVYDKIKHNSKEVGVLLFIDRSKPYLALGYADLFLLEKSSL